MKADPRRPRSILIIDDNDGDVILMREVLNGSKFLGSIHVARDGLEALDLLRKRGDIDNGRLPDIIFLDLSLPRMDGYQFLQEIRGDTVLKAIPVIVFTGSNSPNDIRRAYECGANCYLVKPMGLDILESTLRAVEEFWLGVVKLPDTRNAG
jgi:chemotaxis family two-component system response regulator Rcp1